MFKKIAAVKKAMQAGEMLDDFSAVKLKNQQAMSGIAVAFIGTALVVADAFFGYSIEISDEQISEVGSMVGGVIVAAFGLFQYIATLATSAKVGLQGKSKPDAE